MAITTTKNRSVPRTKPRARTKVVQRAGSNPQPVPVQRRIQSPVRASTGKLPKDPA